MPGHGGSSGKRARPQVLVLAALHQYHAQVRCYGFAELQSVVKWFGPNTLFAEVTEEDLRLRRPEPVKREYPEAIYPLLDAAASISAHALEPAGAARRLLIDRLESAAQEFQEKVEYAQFEESVHAWLASLILTWKTPADVNSRGTDASVRAKNERQRPLYPDDYSRVLEEWNEHFLARIIDGLRKDRPARALVLVGLEHCFWLRDRLAGREDVELLNAEELLAANFADES